MRLLKESVLGIWKARQASVRADLAELDELDGEGILAFAAGSAPRRETSAPAAAACCVP
jgi:hypothetical protein